MAGASNSKTIKKKKIYHIFLAPPPSLGPWFLNHYTTTPEGGQQSTSQTVATLRSVKLAVLRDPVLGSSSHFVVGNSSAPLFPYFSTRYATSARTEAAVRPGDTGTSVSAHRLCIHTTPNTSRRSKAAFKRKPAFNSSVYFLQALPLRTKWGNEQNGEMNEMGELPTPRVTGSCLDTVRGETRRAFPPAGRASPPYPYRHPRLPPPPAPPPHPRAPAAPATIARRRR